MQVRGQLADRLIHLRCIDRKHSLHANKACFRPFSEYCNPTLLYTCPPPSGVPRYFRRRDSREQVASNPLSSECIVPSLLNADFHLCLLS
jgi:hypothetical protein